MSNFYDREGEELTLMEWATKFEDNEYRHVARKVLSGNRLISTVWVGTNLQLGEGSPLIFRTMVFSYTNWDGELDQERY